MVKVAVVYHSGYGHTKRLAEFVAKGATDAGAEASLYSADDLKSPEAGPWDKLAAADAIIFGAPTYMGSASAGFKAFADASSKAWFTGAWKDKIAAGFTNSASISGDKNNTLLQLFTLAAQHGMIWVPPSIPSGYNASGHDYNTAVNRGGFFAGVGTQSHSDHGPDDAPVAAELETGRLLGVRVAEAAKRWAQ